MKKLLAVLFAVAVVLAPTAALASQDDNDASVSQSGKATTGDASGGQHVAVTSNGGSVSIDATNHSEDVDLSSGDASVSNIAMASASGEQDGDNETEVSQSASASSGDAVGGQVVACVCSGDVSIKAANESLDVDSDSGDAAQSNLASASAGIGI